MPHFTQGLRPARGRAGGAAACQGGPSEPAPSAFVLAIVCYNHFSHPAPPCFNCSRLSKNALSPVPTPFMPFLPQIPDPFVTLLPLQIPDPFVLLSPFSLLVRVWPPPAGTFNQCGLPVWAWSPLARTGPAWAHRPRCRGCIAPGVARVSRVMHRDRLPLWAYSRPR